MSGVHCEAVSDATRLPGSTDFTSATHLMEINAAGCTDARFHSNSANYY